MWDYIQESCSLSDIGVVEIYKINDKYHKLVITLKPSVKYPSTLRLDVYRENIDAPRTYIPTVTTLDDGSKLATFTVPHSDFRVGTVLSNFIVRLQGDLNLYDLNESITVLVDGEESYVGKVENNAGVFENGKLVMKSKVDSRKFALIFKDNKPHTIQAVYKGNKEIGFASSEKITITPEQDSNQRYLLTQEIPAQMKYLETPNFRWTLTKGGSPVANEVIERVMPTAIWTAQTNAKGQVIGAGNPSVDNLYSWEVGKYKVGGQYHKNGTLLCECWTDLEIVKNTPTLVFISAKEKGKTAQFKLSDPQGRPMPNRIISIVVGSQTYTKTTDSIGKVYLRINRTGNFKYKATYNGDKNYNAVSINANETING